MPHIVYKENRIELNEGQTVLSALLEHSHEIPNSCRAGVCQSCLMQASDGTVPEHAQDGLKDTLKSQGYFLACICKPAEPLHIIDSKNIHQRYTARVINHEFINDDILRLRLKTEQTFDYHAGQFINLWMNKKVMRSYSLASVDKLDDFLELHIRRVPDGLVSNWLCDEISSVDSLQIQTATGDCFYVPGSPSQKLLLAGTGTGLAPLIGIARDALSQGHQGEIHLIHGARHKDDLYMHQTLGNLAKKYKQFYYHTNVLIPDNGAQTGSPVPLDLQLQKVAGDDIAESKFYLCGDADIVKKLKTKMFLAGASMKNIYSDPFIIAAHGVNT